MTSTGVFGSSPFRSGAVFAPIMAAVTWAPEASPPDCGWASERLAWLGVEGVFRNVPFAWDAADIGEAIPELFAAEKNEGCCACTGIPGCKKYFPAADEAVSDVRWEGSAAGAASLPVRSLFNDRAEWPERPQKDVIAASAIATPHVVVLRKLPF